MVNSKKNKHREKYIPTIQHKEVDDFPSRYIKLRYWASAYVYLGKFFYTFSSDGFFMKHHQSFAVVSGWLLVVRLRYHFVKRQL